LEEIPRPLAGEPGFYSQIIGYGTYIAGIGRREESQGKIAHPLKAPKGGQMKANGGQQTGKDQLMDDHAPTTPKKP